jgi:hypothetical protein
MFQYHFVVLGEQVICRLDRSTVAPALDQFFLFQLYHVIVQLSTNAVICCKDTKNLIKREENKLICLLEREVFMQ